MFQRSLRLPSFLSILFSLICPASGYFYHFIFQLTYPFFCLSYSAIGSLWCIFFNLSYSFVYLKFFISDFQFFISSRSLLNISCIFLIHASVLFICASILFLRFWITFTIITLNSFPDRCLTPLHLLVLWAFTMLLHLLHVSLSFHFV